MTHLKVFNENVRGIYVKAIAEFRIHELVKY